MLPLIHYSLKNFVNPIFFSISLGKVFPTVYAVFVAIFLEMWVYMDDNVLFLISKLRNVLVLNLIMGAISGMNSLAKDYLSQESMTSDSYFHTRDSSRIF